MAKTLRVREATGWTTKAEADVPANRLSAEEIDDNFLAMETFASQMGLKNRIINGNFNVWQRGTSFTLIGFIADRWVVSASANVPAVQRSSIDLNAIPNSKSIYSAMVTVTADAVAGSYQILSSRIENVRTFSGQKATFSFWTYCSTDKDIAVSFRQYFGTGGSPSASVDFNGTTKKFAVTDEWTYHTTVVDIPSIAGKTLGTDGNDYLLVMLWFSAGSNFDTNTDTLGHQSGVFYIADIQLEEGEVATPFEDRPISLETLLCHRYYWRSKVGQVNAQGYTDNAISSWRFGPGVPMRTTPTATSDLSGATNSYVDNATWAVNGSDGRNGGLFCFYMNSSTARANIYHTSGADDYIALAAEI